MSPVRQTRAASPHARQAPRIVHVVLTAVQTEPKKKWVIQVRDTLEVSTQMVIFGAGTTLPKLIRLISVSQFSLKEVDHLVGR